MTATPIAATLDRARLVHKALRVVLSDLDYGLTASTVYVTNDHIVVVAPSAISAARWELTHPGGEVAVDGQTVPLHIAIEGDVEGGRS